MPDRAAVGLLDMSVVIDLEQLQPEQLPAQVAVSAVTMAELAAGPAATQDVAERARRQDRLQRAEAAFDPLPFGVEAVRAYGRVYAAVLGQGARRADGSRTCSSHRWRWPNACHWSPAIPPTSPGWRNWSRSSKCDHQSVPRGDGTN